MCVPLGPRRKAWGNSSDHVCVEKITKSKVDEILIDGDFECFVKGDEDTKFQRYAGCMQNLFQVLHDGKTRVKIAGSKTPGYHKKYRTVVMVVPKLSATFLLRTELGKW